MIQGVDTIFWLINMSRAGLEILVWPILDMCKVMC